MLNRQHKAQSTLEYAALFAVVVGAIIAGQLYFRRGIQGKLKSSADKIGEQHAFDATGTVTKTINSTSHEIVNSGTSTTTTNQQQQQIENWQSSGDDKP